MKHFVFIILIALVLTIFIFLPYTHGDYDPVAVVISQAVQVGSFTATLLVPLGLLGLILKDYRGFLKYATIVVLVLIVLGTALGAFTINSRSTAIIILIGGIVLLILLARKISGKVISYYFISIPLIVVGIRMVCIERVKNATTEFVIGQSRQLVHDIEAYKEANGNYPVSLVSTIEDYRTSVCGIDRFHYERNGEAYNVYFEQFSDMLGTEEIVMYNELGEHEMTVHNQDLLRVPEATILRGYHKVIDLQQENWKIFYFD
jgi:hypothetical protein